MNKLLSFQMISRCFDQELVGMLLRSLLRPFIFIEVMSEGAVLPDLPVEHCLEGLFILLVVHASNDCIASGKKLFKSSLMS